MSLFAFGGAPASAQTVGDVIGTCAPIISEEYNGDTSRYGQCIAAVSDFLSAIGAPSGETNAQVVNLVVALTELYQDTDGCLTPQTELPQAISTAGNASTDAEQRAQILQVSATVASCQVDQTASIFDPSRPPSDF